MRMVKKTTNFSWQLTNIIAVLGLFTLAGCLEKAEITESPPQIIADPAEQIIAPELLKLANLKIVWSNVVPLKENEKIKDIFIRGNRVYAFTNYNYLVSMDRNNLVPVHSNNISPPGYPILGINLYEDKLISIISNNLVELDQQYCTELSSESMDFSVSIPAVRNSTYYYVAGTDKRVHVLRQEDKVEIFEVAAVDDGDITCVIADDDIVIIATDRGSVIGMTPQQPTQLWEFSAAGAINNPVIRDGDTSIFSSGDSYVYKIDLKNGKLIWKYRTKALLEEAPKVTEKVVYQCIDGTGLIALNKKDKKIIWELTDGMDILAESKDKAYLLTNSHKLVVMDNNKQKKISSIELKNISKYASNMSDSKIYIGDELGRILCLEPED